MIVAAIFDFKPEIEGSQEIILHAKTLTSDRISLIAQLISNDGVICLKEYQRKKIQRHFSRFKAEFYHEGPTPKIW